VSRLKRVRLRRRLSRPPNRAQQVERFRKSELLSDKGVQEAAAPHFASRLHPAQCHQQIAPRRRQRLADGGVPEDDAPAFEQLPRERLRVRRAGAAQ